MEITGNIVPYMFSSQDHFQGSNNIKYPLQYEQQKPNYFNPMFQDTTIKSIPQLDPSIQYNAFCPSQYDVEANSYHAVRPYQYEPGFFCNQYPSLISTALPLYLPMLQAIPSDDLASSIYNDYTEIPSQLRKNSYNKCQDRNEVSNFNRESSKKISLKKCHARAENRVSNACGECRTRKRRCSTNRPCEGCVRNERQCADR